MKSARKRAVESSSLYGQSVGDMWVHLPWVGFLKFFSCLIPSLSTLITSNDCSIKILLRLLY
jgi:hypothetical protein